MDQGLRSLKEDAVRIKVSAQVTVKLLNVFLTFVIMGILLQSLREAVVQRVNFALLLNVQECHVFQSIVLLVSLPQFLLVSVVLKSTNVLSITVQMFDAWQNDVLTEVSHLSHMENVVQVNQAVPTSFFSCPIVQESLACLPAVKTILLPRFHLVLAVLTQNSVLKTALRSLVLPRLVLTAIWHQFLLENAVQMKECAESIPKRL